MGTLSLFGFTGLLLLGGAVVFVVIVVPLFYTVVTRWAFSGGEPVRDDGEFAARQRARRDVEDGPQPADGPADTA
jgi:hypothetical protein